MRSTPSTILRGLAASTVLLAVPALAHDTSDLFHKAYYLEHAEGRLEEALDLYRKVASGSGDKALRAEAAERAAGIAEEFAASDLARLVPEDAILFAQLDRPGEQLSLLLDQLGLLGEAHRIAEDRIAISPLLIDHALGLRGAAVALTDMGFNGQPNGIVLLHPGSHEGLKGLIDTALPAVGKRVDPVGEFPVWTVEGQAYVCLTRRLVVAGNSLDQIRGVVKRIESDGAHSLAEDERFVSARGAMQGGEQGGGLVNFYLNADPLKPLIRMALQSEARNDPGAAMALNLLDIESLQSLSGRLGVDHEGLGLDLALDLEEGHRNLVFNLMRRPTLSSETLELVPEGAAFFMATAFNPKADVAPIDRDSADQPIVSALDFGRELFGNVVDVAVFGMPEATGAGLPDVSVVVRVNDAERSLALWELGLDMVSQATGSNGAVTERFGGAQVSRYEIEDVPLYLASKGDRLVISPNKGSIERALGGGYKRSIKHDAVLGGGLSALDQSSTMMLAACPGRVAAMAKPFMSEHERMQIEHVAGMLGETALTVTTQHSDTRLALAARVENIPDVSGMVGQLIAQAKEGGYGMHRAGHELEVVTSGWGEPQKAQAQVEQAYGKAKGKAKAHASGADMDELVHKFNALAKEGNRAAAVGLGQRMVATVGDAKELNNFAWALLTEDRYGQAYDAVARTISLRSNELTDYSQWAYVDTLALAEYRAGNYAEAVSLQELTIELVGGDTASNPELGQSLETYRAALADEGSVVVH